MLAAGEYTTPSVHRKDPVALIVYDKKNGNTATVITRLKERDKTKKRQTVYRDQAQYDLKDTSIHRLFNCTLLIQRKARHDQLDEATSQWLERIEKGAAPPDAFYPSNRQNAFRDYQRNLDISRKVKLFQSGGRYNTDRDADMMTDEDEPCVQKRESKANNKVNAKREEHQEEEEEDVIERGCSSENTSNISHREHCALPQSKHTDKVSGLVTATSFDSSCSSGSA
jgi:hypothetical protein